jgi:hypothetical protein
LSRSLARTAVLACVLTALLVAPGRAVSATPCWKQIVSDWSADGVITNTYAVDCYRAALRNMPEDVRDYTSLGDDIQSALQAAISARAHVRHLSGRSLPGRVDSLGPSNADSIPLPLLILAGLATLVLAAGTAGALSRRLEDRRVPATARPRTRG